ncbi:MAG: hypothetical protein COA78_06045, partial [Blastopirellula sp.]
LGNIIGVIYVRHALFTTPTRPFGTEGAETAAGNSNQLTSNLRNMIHINNWNQLLGTVIVVVLFIASSILLLVILRELNCDFTRKNADAILFLRSQCRDRDLCRYVRITCLL